MQGSHVRGCWNRAACLAQSLHDGAPVTAGKPPVHDENVVAMRARFVQAGLAIRSLIYDVAFSRPCFNELRRRASSSMSKIHMRDFR